MPVSKDGKIETEVNNRFQPIKFVNSVVPSPSETQPRYFFKS